MKFLNLMYNNSNIQAEVMSDQQEAPIRSKEEQEQPEKNDVQNDDDSDQGFYNNDNKQQKQEQEEQIQTENKKTKKSKPIKKKKKRGENSKKQSQQRKKKQQYLIAASATARQILEKMRDCSQKDIRLYESKKKANAKLVYSIELMKQLRNVYVCERFLQEGGLQLFQQWLKRLPDGSECGLTMKKRVFDILLTLNASEEYFDRAPELKKMIQRNKKNAYLKDICEMIMSKWMQGL